MSRKVPDRWRDYIPCTLIPIKNERIISFKTPLSRKFDHNGSPDDEGIIESERFTPTDLVNDLASKDLHLGLVLDFTFTKRYYQSQEFIDKGIKYTKLMCPGHEIPKEKDVNRFQLEVYSFLNQDNTGSLVGVHCTHGVNRTGYMVCRYLIDCKGYKPEEAIKAFNEARGHPIERENYLEDLKTRIPGHGSHLQEIRQQNLKEKEDLTTRSQRNLSTHQSERGTRPPGGRHFNSYETDIYDYEPHSRSWNERSFNSRYHPYNHSRPPRHYNEQEMYFSRNPYHDRPQGYNRYYYHDTRGYNDYDDYLYTREHDRYGQRRYTEFCTDYRYHLNHRHDADSKRPRTLDRNSKR